MKRRKLVWFSGMLGWLFFSVAPTTQGFIAGTGKAANILVKKVHAPQWLLGYNFVFGCAAGFKENELKAAVT